MFYRALNMPLQWYSAVILLDIKVKWEAVIHVRTNMDTGRKFNVHKTFRRYPGRLLNVLCTFNLRPVSTRSFLTIYVILPYCWLFIVNLMLSNFDDLLQCMCMFFISGILSFVYLSSFLKKFFFCFVVFTPWVRLLNWKVPRR